LGLLKGRPFFYLVPR